MIKRTIFVFTIINVILNNQYARKPYNGGNKFKTMHTNPALLNKLLGKIKTVDDRCKEITGVGHPILSVRQLMQNVDNSLDTTNAHTYVKAIFFNESEDKKRRKTSYKLVIQIKTFGGETYVAVEGVYKKIGNPSFEVETYYMDDNLENVKTVIEEFSLSRGGYVGCGDIKAIYSQRNPVLPSPNLRRGGHHTNPGEKPYAANNGLQNPPSADLVAKVLALMTGSS